MNFRVILYPLPEAIVTMLAAITTLLCALAIDPEPGPAVLAVVLCLSLSRSHLDRDFKGRLEAAIALPVVGLVAVGVGMLLLHLPWVGAFVFVMGISASIWLRRFGLMARRAGSLIALPFVAILTTPYVPTTKVGPLLAIFIPVIVALFALLWVSVFHALARLTRALPPTRTMTHVPVPSTMESSLRPDSVTRMAIQMAVALSVSFVIGYVFFAERWAWIVLTAFIVGSGNRGRLDVAYKSVLRILGAAAGTAIALLISVHVGAHDVSTVVLILTAVFLGTWLRPLGYAWWALFVTLALALLQGFTGFEPRNILWLRLEEIVIGAIIGVMAAWFVLPVQSTAVLRRRLADALATLSDGLDPAKDARTSDDFIAALARVEQVAPAFRASRWITKTRLSVQPADWVDTLMACREPAAMLIDAGEAPGSARRAVGAARKAIRDPSALAAALNAMLQSLTGKSPA